VETLPQCDTVPLGTEPDWKAWRLTNPKTIIQVTKWTGTPNLINIRTSFTGGDATRLQYTYNEARPITDTDGKHLPSFDYTLPYP
jgi:hypothetical protein